MSEQHPPQPGHDTSEGSYGTTPPPPTGAPEPAAPEYGAPVYGAPAYTEPPAPVAGRNGMAIGALVVGIVGVVLAFCLPPLGLVLGVVALVLGFLARRKAAVNGGAGQAMAGIILGAVSIVLAVVVLAVFGSLVNKFSDCANKTTQAEKQACVQGKM